MLVVMNEAAGRTDPEAVEGVVDQLRKAGDVEVATIREEGDLDAALDRRGDRVLVVLGGDGTLHSVVNLLWQRGEAGSCPVGLIPLGTGNDFARGCGIPLDPQEAAHVILDTSPQEVDLITDDRDRVVANAVHVGVGADAAVVARPLKRFFRVGAFPMGGLLAGIRAKGWRLRVEVDGRTIVWSAKILMVGISNAATIAGGTAQLAPAARPTDGLLHLTVWMRTGLLGRIGYAIGLMTGRHPHREDVHQVTGHTAAVAGEPFHINADGEVSGPFTHRSWTIQPGAWRFIMPAQEETPSAE